MSTDIPSYLYASSQSQVWFQRVYMLYLLGVMTAAGMNCNYQTQMLQNDPHKGRKLQEQAC